MGEEEGSELGHLIAAEGRPVEEEVSETLVSAEVVSAVDQLPEAERKVIHLRFGTQGEEPRTQAQTARALGCSPQDAARLEARALKRLADDPAMAALREAA